MKAVGVVVEYNPFHNGHFYHISQSKSNSNADVVIAVMSGHFLQRGEPALLDKWHRTKMALNNGVDIVIELPYVFCTGYATAFAEGAIQLLEAIGCTHFAFGSEEGSIQPFLNTFHILKKHEEQYNALIKHYVTTGISYPQSLYKAYEELRQMDVNSTIDLSQPNNILGYHYIEAAKRLNLQIEPMTIPRIKAGFHDDIDNNSTIASATGIRKAIFEQQTLQEIKQFLPPASFTLLKNWQSEYGSFIHWETLWPYLRFAILRNTPEQLSRFADVSEGIEFALIKAAKKSDSFNQFMNQIKSKRYTWTRLQRIVTHIYTGITKDQLHESTKPSYIRLLGMSQNGQAYLSKHKKQFQLPLISRVASTKDPMLLLDIRATDMYALGVEYSSGKQMASDYQTPPIRL
ncbi:nucleotidyltransferase [Lysinibacillus sp. SGAir0095]|uniref:nucleotidyltransferase n=1 Tax=Lysinibacillus sp. SGAir0095 TaxID=2070463 RepID=UPI0010CD5974|nr:nucleotidyltransferase [Lysinibacillus sp. SGAir0095]QCR31696.1 nucleotidyltransferase [Lysinibacillus sp. SGAir0095]